MNITKKPDLQWLGISKEAGLTQSEYQILYDLGQGTKKWK